MALIVMPARNEADNLPFVVEDLRRFAPGHAILIVDDASDDGTRNLLPSLGVSWLRLRIHLGVGGAMRAGLRWARREGFTQVVRCDGDGQHRGEDVERLLNALAPGIDAVLGSRYLGDPIEGSEGDYRTRGVRRYGQRVLSSLLTVWTGQRLTDPTSGLWAFGPAAIRLLSEYHPTGYPEPELLLLMRRHRLTVREVPVVMRERMSGRTSLTMGRQLTALARVLLALLIVPLRSEEVGS